MAVTETSGTKVLELTTIDEDWTASESMDIFSIQFVPGASNDILVIKDSTDAGATIAYMSSSDGDPRIIYFYHTMTPMIDFSECTLSSGHSVIIRTI